MEATITNEGKREFSPEMTELVEGSRENIMESSTFLYNKTCLRVSGLWPYQNPKLRIFCRTSAVMILGSIFIPTVLIMNENRRDYDYLISSMPTFLYFMESIAKFTYFIANQKKLEQIFDYIKYDFDTRTGRQLEILENYGKETRHFNHIYAAYMFMASVVFNTSYFQPEILDLIVPLNESRPRPIPQLARYYITTLDESFNFVLVHNFIVDLFTITFFVGHDTLMLNCTQHACALFQIVINEIQDCVKIKKNQSKRDEKVNTIIDENTEDNFYRRISRAIDLHKRALEYSAIVDKMYAYVNLFIIGLSLLVISLSEYQTVTHLNDADLVCRYVIFTIGEFIHILYFNWPSQRIQDHSLLVYQACYDCEWYRGDIPNRCKKLLKLLIARSQIPSKLTAGKVYTLGYEYFANILKASMSFFTMLLSVN